VSLDVGGVLVTPALTPDEGVLFVAATGMTGGQAGGALYALNATDGRWDGGGRGEGRGRRGGGDHCASRHRSHLPPRPSCDRQLWSSPWSPPDPTGSQPSVPIAADLKTVTVTSPTDTTLLLITLDVPGEPCD